MRFIALSILFIPTLLPGSITPAFGEASGPDHFRVTGVAANDVLNIREAPQANATKIGEIPPDADGIRNLGCQGGLSFEEWQAASEAEREAGRRTRWCRIEFGGVEGWVAGWFLAEGTAAELLGPASPGLRAGQGDFDATGTIPCAQYAGQPMRTCQFGVARGEAGSATVVVTHTDGWQRALFFENGEFISADASEAGGGFDASASKEADLFTIRVDEERYEIPEAVIFGG